MKFSTSLLAAAFATIAFADPVVYMIRHGEKPDDGNGLNTQGMQRAQCLRSVFGSSSQYNIGHIMAQMPKDSGKRQRPYDTVKPLADDLGLEVDISCDRDDPECVEDVVKNYDGDGNILICWEHKKLTDIAEQLGAQNAPEYEGYDKIWTDPPNYTEITDISSENCPGLDD